MRPLFHSESSTICLVCELTCVALTILPSTLALVVVALL